MSAELLSSKSLGLPELNQSGLEDVISWGANRVIEATKVKRENPQAAETILKVIYGELQPIEATLNLLYPLHGTEDWGEIFEQRAYQHISELIRIGNEDIYSPIRIESQPPALRKRG